MTSRDPSRGRRTQRRAAERRQLKAQRSGPAVLPIPDHVKALTDPPEGETHA